MKIKINKRNGFTLVELLIVIALIAILSVAVLATINPIEQSNKARDAAMKNDAAEVLSAYERYYASQTMYPWNVAGTPDTTVLLAGNTALFGVVGVGGTSGVLISTSELKSSFASKKPFQATVTNLEDNFYTYHNATTNSNYVCYFPKANANRTGTNASSLKCIDTANNRVLDQSATCVIPTTWSYAASATVANAACVPEGLIQ